MAPMYEFINNNSNLNVQAAAIEAAHEDNVRREKQELFRQLKQVNKDLNEMDRRVSLAVRTGNTLPSGVGKHRTWLRNQKRAIAAQIKNLR